MIREIRNHFNASFDPERYRTFLAALDQKCDTHVSFRIAETPIFLSKSLLQAMADAGAALTEKLLAWPQYLASARKSIPQGYAVAGDSAHPNFLTADFALVLDEAGELVPRLVELQAFPSVYGYQVMLNESYRESYELGKSPQGAELGIFLSGLTEDAFWNLLRQTVLGGHAPEHVVLTEVDPEHQKTLPDFLVTSARLGIAVVDIAKLVPVGKKLHYRNQAGQLVRIDRIYNRAIADEMIARKIELSFDLTADWEVEWAGHPNWYFLISKYSVPWLSRLQGEIGWPTDEEKVVPPAEFVDEFLSGAGFARLRAAGVDLPDGEAHDIVYKELLLKPLFSFAGKGIQFGPSRRELQAIPISERGNYLVQQRMTFEPTIVTPHGMTQAEIRILYLWPDDGKLTPVLPLVRLGRGKMMGVDHNKDLEWVGASAAFWVD